MGWTNSGYVPDEFKTVIASYYDAFRSNPEYASLTYTRFEASREYEQFYVAAQIDLGYQSALAEVYQKIQEYVVNINFRIAAPRTTATAITSNLTAELGFPCALKPKEIGDAGQIFLAIDYDGSEENNRKIAAFMRSSVVGGTWTNGDIIESVSLDNGQPWSYSWYKGTKRDLRFRLVIKVSRTTQIEPDEEYIIKQKFDDNFAAIYSMGKDIEPEAYFEIVRDAPYASNIICEYTTDGTTWSAEPMQIDFKENINATLDEADITVIGAGD